MTLHSCFQPASPAHILSKCYNIIQPPSSPHLLHMHARTHTQRHRTGTHTRTHKHTRYQTLSKSQTLIAETLTVGNLLDGGGDNSVVRAPDSRLKGRGVESLLERRENFRLQGRLSVLTLISVSVPPPCYHSST